MNTTPLPGELRPRRIDMHVHMVGNGGGGSGGWLRLNGWHRWLAGFMLRQLGVPASALEGDLESIYAEHLVMLVRDSSMDVVVLLAHERVHDPDGTPRNDLGSMFVPNDVVLALAKKFPEFLAGVSIHPARRDGLDELERCLASGAVLVANNDWQDNPAQAAELTAAGLAPTSQLESGIAATPSPGLYTALLAGLNKGTGIGLVEVYDRQ
jgi:hypothetical protein